MGKRSSEFVALRGHLCELRHYLLPTPFDPTGHYSDRELTRTLAYRLLAHAELEAFVEQRCWHAVQIAARSWKHDRSPTKTLTCVMAFDTRTSRPIPPSVEVPSSDDKDAWRDALEIDNRVKNAVDSYYNTVSNNNGIRESNLLRLLLPAGVETAQLSPTFLATMDSLGRQRGDAAHQSTVSLRVSNPPDPKSEYDRIGQLLPYLDSIDRALQEASSSA